MTMRKNKYFLLPFNFTRISGKEILVNELGDLVIAPIGTTENVVLGKIDQSSNLFKTLVSNFFLSLTPIPDQLNIIASRLAEKKRFLDDFTSLHIFVLTLQCNQNCIYCQASSRIEGSSNCTMSKEDMERAVKLMFKSPSQNLTMEFQGGEPSLLPDLVYYGIQLAEKINEVENRNMTYVLCTNCVSLSDRILDICQKFGVIISTSLDGPEWLHNANRGKKDSYQKVIAGIRKAKERLGANAVSALMTTSVQSLDFPEAIVDEYVANNFHSIFFRALNPYGLALKTENWEEYNEKFIQFYKRGLDHIISLNLHGIQIVEEFAAIVLRKMLTPFCTGFVDLQSPSGIINGVLVYNYDGYVYASDESRMLVEYGDYTFRLGSLKDKYSDLIYSNKVKKISEVWANECLAGCSDCAFRIFCGADPVRNHSTQGDMYGYRPNSLLCKKYKAIIEYLISLMIERPGEVMPIFNRWIAR